MKKITQKIVVVSFFMILINQSSWAQVSQKILNSYEDSKNSKDSMEIRILRNNVYYNIATPGVDESKTAGYKGTTKRTVKKSPGVKIIESKLISDFSFKNGLKKDMEIVLFGDQAPVSGFLLDISGKTTAKLTGRIPTKRDIWTLEIEAGQKDNNIPLFNAGKYNGVFTAGINWNSVRINKYSKLLTNADYRYTQAAKELVDYVREFNILKINAQLIDSARVMMYCIKAKPINTTGIFRVKYETKLKEADDILKSIEGFEDFDGKTFEIINKEIDNSHLELYKKIALKYVSPDISDRIKNATTIKAVNDLIGLNVGFDMELLVSDINKLLIRLADRPKLIADAEYNIAQPYWVKKSIRWFSISPNVSLKSYAMYGIDKNGKILEKPENKTFVDFKLTVWYNMYRVNEHSIRLARFGIEPLVGNNLKNFTEIKYKVSDTLQIEPSGNVILAESTTDGLFREKDSRITTGLFFNYRAEFYWLPTKNFVPGFSAKLGYLKDGILPMNNRKWRPQISVVLNLLNQDKTKALVTLQPYLLLDNIDKEQEEISEGVMRTLSFREKLSAGITIGLPISAKSILSK